jgi:hypothetical protein
VFASDEDGAETEMRKIWVIAAAMAGFGAVAGAAEEPGDRPGVKQPATPTVPPASGSSSSDLGRSGGVITPPEVDPEIKRPPPPSGARMPVIPPPGTPGGDPSIKPK